ncbi:MAG: hypothetical protein IJ193_02290 [Bacilli bacterium]|nr:hypothetical protein [Bacilli bacterium]
MLQNLYRERNQYRTLRANLGAILSNLKSGKGSIDDCNKITSYYMVDDNWPDNGTFKSTSDEISGIINKIEAEIIPWLDQKVRQTDRTIGDLELAESMKE